jgi:hypothetical protein
VSYTIERRTQAGQHRNGDESYYVIIADGVIIDEYETIEAAREAIRWLP